MEVRSGEVANTHFRTNRYFCISGNWYFSTRENLQIGPFESRDDAEVEMMFFMRHLRENGQFAEQQAVNSANSIG